MEQPPPLSPEEVSNLAGAEYAQLGQPQTVKVFGILHIAFAAFGLLSSIWTIFISVAGNPFLNLSAANPAAQAQAKAQLAMEKQMLPATVAMTVLTVIIAALMLTAGIKMLKKRKDGLKWSNRYAWTSLFGKAINLVVAITISIPATKKMTNEIAGGTPVPGLIESMIVAGMIIGVLAACIYPILCLILLNKPAVKTWFANQKE